MIYINRWARLALAIQFILLAGPVFITKPAIEGVMRARFLVQQSQDGPDGSTPSLEDFSNELRLAFSNAGVIYKLLSLTYGMVMDWGGPKLSGLLGCTCLLTGVVALASTTLHNYHITLNIACISLALAMIPNWLSIQATAQLFGNRKRTVIGTLSALGPVGALLYYFMKALKESIFPRSTEDTIFYTHIGLVLCEMIIVALLWPSRLHDMVAQDKDRRMRKTLKEELHVDKETEENETMLPLSHEETCEESICPRQRLQTLALFEQMWTPQYLLYCVYYGVVFTVRFAFYNNAVGIIEKVSTSESFVQEKLRLFHNIYLILGCISTVATAAVTKIDTCFVCSGISFVLSITYYVSSSIVNAVAEESTQIPEKRLTFVFVLFSLVSSTVHSMLYAFVADFFGFSHFGLLTGVISMNCSIFLFAEKQLSSMHDLGTHLKYAQHAALIATGIPLLIWVITPSPKKRAVASAV